MHLSISKINQIFFNSLLVLTLKNGSFLKVKKYFFIQFRFVKLNMLEFKEKLNLKNILKIQIFIMNVKFNPIFFPKFK